MPRLHIHSTWSLLALTLVISLGLPGLARGGRVSAQIEWAPPRAVYVATTGHTVSGAFLDVWRAWGADYAWGNPITEEIEQDGRVVQYFEYARFEYWPEDPNGEIVHLGRVGEELRPHAVYRRWPAEVDGQAAGAGLEAARFALAWLPLDADSAARPATENWRYVPETGHSVQLGFKAFWEWTGEAGYLGNPLTEEYSCGETTFQVFERGQLAWRPGADVWMVPIGSVLAARYGLDTAPVPQGDLPSYSEDLFVPPPPPEPVVPVPPAPDPYAERWIEVNLSWQYLIAWQGDVVVLETYVSTGRAGFETPAGTFYINSKYDSQDMEGVIGGEYYNVPGVPWVMYFTNDGHALHGTYWHDNFGVPMSHGCVNLPMWAAEALYAWAPIGTRVDVHW